MDKNKKNEDKKIYFIVNGRIDKGIIREANKKFDKLSFVDVLSSSFMIYLSRLDYKGIFSVNYTDCFLRRLTKKENPLFSSKIFLSMELPFSMTGKEAIQKCVEEKAEALRNKTSSLDTKKTNHLLSESPQGKDSIKINILNSEEKFIKTDEGYLLEIRIDPKGNKYTLAFSKELKKTEKYSRTFNPKSITRFLKHLVQDPTCSIRDLPIMAPQEEDKLLLQWNKTDRDYFLDTTIQKLFEEKVERNPDSIAIVCEETSLTYRELNEKANQVANYIKEKHHIQPDTLISLCLDRGEHLIIGILGILKAGGAYVPIDPNYPDDRIRYILEDTRTSLVLTNTRHQQKLEGMNANLEKKITEKSKETKILSLDDLKIQEKLALQPVSNPDVSTTSTNLAYIIYTSGTTGKPKGVMIEHRNIVNLILAVQEIYGINEKDSFLFYRSYAFDGVIEETILPLVSGAKLNICQTGINDLAKFFKVIKEGNVSIANINSETAQVLEGHIGEDFKIKKIIAGGTKLNLKSFSYFLKNNITVFNSYGPTECTVDSTYFTVDSRGDDWIGKPIYNSKCYVLSANLSLLPVGAVGELYIGGAGVARGYLNQPKLTEERFIPNPFQTEEEKREKMFGEGGRNSRLYKTGDLVRWLPDGNLEYIGRDDFQVKIRGYRIELAEIENVLSSYKGVKQSVILVRERSASSDATTGSKYLVGYYISENTLNEEEMLSYLQSKLPEYMVPTALVYLAHFPLTVNGKIDKNAFPNPSFTNSKTYVSPRNNLEKQVVEIWAEVLGLESDEVGIQDDIFRLGGDSIVSIQIVSRLRQRLDLRVSVKDIFIYKTIERLYDNILSKAQDKIEIKAKQGILKGEVSLLPIQKWFFESKFNYPDYWNQAFIVKTPDLETSRLQRSILKLIKHHDAFRLRYRKDTLSNQYIQFYDEKACSPEMKVLDIKMLTEREREEILHETLSSWQSCFNLEKGPLFCIGYIHGYEDKSARIFFALHHLIVDTVSWRILTEDLMNLYEGRELGKKGSSYRQWVKTVKMYGENHGKEKEYWTDLLADYEGEKIAYKDITDHTSFRLSREQTRQLLHESNRAYHTQINDILITALGYALEKISGNKINYIVLEGHGREEIDYTIDINKTLGWFTTMYPVKIEIKEDVEESLKCVKEILRKIPNRGIGYGSLFGYKNKELPRICFNYLGIFDRIDTRKQAEDLWSISGENAGRWIHPTNKDYNIINITGLVIDECLEFKIVSKLSRECADKLRDQFKLILDKIINFTTQQTRTYLTASDVQNLINQSYLDKIQKKKEVEGIYKANSLQQGFIYHNLNQGDIDDAYKVQLIWKYEAKISPSYLKEAWENAQRRYSSLRLRFAWEEELVQIIDKEGALNWKYLDLSKEKDIQAQIEKIQKEDRYKPYNLDEGNLFRVTLLKEREDLYTCILSYHHSILDGWSNPILIGYVHNMYLRLQDKKTLLLQVDGNYEISQKYIQEHEKDNEEYWLNYISKIEERENLSSFLKAGQQKIKLKNYKHIKKEQEKTLVINGEQYKLLKELSRKEGVTLNAILQYVWHKTLSIYGNMNQTIIGTTISGRDIPINGIEDSVGLYINTLPLIIDHQSEINKKRTILSAIRSVLDNINEINARSNISLARLQKGGERLFDCLFIYENYPKPTNEERLKELKVRFIKSIEKIDYPLGVIVYEEETKLLFNLRYAAELFDKEVLERLLETVKDFLKQIIKDPFQSEGNLNYLTKEDHKKIIQIWNDTDKDYLKDETIQDLFRKQVKKTPSNIAVIESSSLVEYTYKNLKEESDLLSKYILKYKNKKNTRNVYSNYRKSNNLDGELIAVFTEKSYNQVLSVLSIINSNYGYLPLNIEWPAIRVDEILKRACVKLVIISKSLYNKEDTRKALSSHYDLLVIEDILSEIRNDIDLRKNLNTITLPRAKANDIAYVIFTSGSTGKPKGVTISHRGALNTINAVNKKFNLTQKDKILSLSELSFDLSVYDIFGVLITGGSIVLPEQDKLREPLHWLDLINKYRITIWNSVPQLADLLVNELKRNNSSIKSLKLFLLSGDWIPLTLPDRLKENYPSARIISLGGATEASIWSIWYEINQIKRGWKSIPYGTPMPNQKMYVLNYHDELCSLDVIGEIHIGGVGLALNYWQDEEKTQKSFINHRKLGRLYRTGDMGKWNRDGYIEILGRKDFQVKINGYRIELGEIENVLSNYPGIKQSTVLVKEKTASSEIKIEAKYLVGYYVSERSLEEQKIISYLKSKLPEYMVPSFLLHLTHIPLTTNGKLDRKALPEPHFTNTKKYTAPKNKLEEQAVRIWAEVLDLPKDTIGIEDDFFRLGGNSILAIPLISQINRELDLNLRVSSIFKHTTIHKLLSSENEIPENIIRKIDIIHPEDQKLSFAQERLWFIENYEGGTCVYNIPMFFEISPDMDLEILELSLQSIVTRHEILRTFIKENKGKTYQCVDASNSLSISKIEVKNRLELDAFLKKDKKYIYDLRNEYPIRINLYNLNKGGHLKNYLSITIHHIAFDGWSTEIFFKELQRYYDHYLNSGEKGKTLVPELSIQYKDFASWQRSYLTGKRLSSQLEYWKNKLHDYETINLIPDKLRPQTIDYRGADVSFEIDERTSSKLRDLAKELKVSLYSLLLSGFYLMLRIYSNQEDLVVGIPVANRHYGQVENVIGFFVNILALRVNIKREEKIKDYIEWIGKEIKESQIYQDLPFEKLIEGLNVSKDTSRHPVFQIVFTVQNFENKKRLTEEETKNANRLLMPYIVNKDQEIAKFDLSIFIDDQKEKITGIFNYAICLYKEDTIERFKETYTYILQQLSELAKNPEQQEQKKISNLNYIRDEAYKNTIEAWNNTEKYYPEEKTIQELFEEQVERIPDNLAIISEEGSFTYEELNKKANQLAHYIREKHKILPDTFVALCLDRSEQMLIGMLAILKAGGAYVPINPEYPDSRIQYVLKDTKTCLVLTNKIYEKRLKDIINSKAPEIINIEKDESKNNSHTLKQVIEIFTIDDSKNQAYLGRYPPTNLKINESSKNLAYVIYTSGTTGYPKGVMIEHQGITSLVKGFDYMDLDQSDSFIQLSDVSFDAATFEIWTPLLKGLRLFLPNNKMDLITNINSFQEILIKYKIAVLWLTKSLFDQLFFMNINIFKEIKYFLVGGEALNKDTIYKLINSKNSPKSVINGYGPTENTTFSCMLDIKKSNIRHTNSIPIGVPITNRKAYVLTQDLIPLPIGAIGELYVGGLGLARGYLNQPELTKAKFIPNPFQTEEERQDKKFVEEGRNARLYKTGDLVRWLPDGNLEYIGRQDFQVKIRGYRIELEEIENILSSYPGVKQSAVLEKERADSFETKIGTKYLVGYYVSESPLNEYEVLSYLHNKLPEYMVPSILIHLPHFPLTGNGKLDRKALPEPSFTGFKTYIAPRNEIERQIAEIWAEVLGLSDNEVGIANDFFRLGGDSIVSIQIVSRLRQRLNLNVSVKDIFTYKTIKELYDHVLSKEQIRAEIKTEQGKLIGDVPFLPIQEWFFDSNFKYPHYWNQSFLIKTPALDPKRLQSGVLQLIEHHDAFRLRYKKHINTRKGRNNPSIQYTQFYDGQAYTPEIRVLDITTLPKESREKDLQKILSSWQSSFDLEKGPVHCIGYLYGYEDGSARIFFSLHHLVVDTVSWRVLREDLKTLYDGQTLGQKGSSYRQWTKAIKHYASKHEKEKDYWGNVLSDHDHNLQSLEISSGGEDNYANFSLSRETTQQLLHESNRAYHTQIDDILLTALGYALQDLTKDSVHHIVLEGHGREEIEEGIDTTKTVGWFTTMYPVRLELREDIGESLKHIKETLRQIPNKGIGYGALVSYSNSILPRVTFNYLGQFDQRGTFEESKQNKQMWRIIEEDNGISIDPRNYNYSLISINGLVSNGSLRFNITTKLGDQRTSLFSKSFKEKLEKIILHCACQDISDHTPADFKDFEPYVLFNGIEQTRYQSRLFLFPPGEGGAESYFNNIVPKLKDLNLVAFNNYYIFLQEKKEINLMKSISFERLASYYISYIKSLQPTGPYNLFGWSFGGVLSLEIARQLIRGGEKVKNIFMIDSLFNYKMASIQAGIKSKELFDNINYKYSPPPLEINNSKIYLFKAGKLPEKKEHPTDLCKILNHYVEETEYNYLDSVLKKKSNFKAKKMNSNHYNWVNNQDEITKICNIILKAF